MGIESKNNSVTSTLSKQPEGLFHYLTPPRPLSPQHISFSPSSFSSADSSSSSSSTTTPLEHNLVTTREYLSQSHFDSYYHQQPSNYENSSTEVLSCKGETFSSFFKKEVTADGTHLSVSTDPLLPPPPCSSSFSSSSSGSASSSCYLLPSISPPPSSTLSSSSSSTTLLTGPTLESELLSNVGGEGNGGESQSQNGNGSGNESESGDGISLLLPLPPVSSFSTLEEVDVEVEVIADSNQLTKSDSEVMILSKTSFNNDGSTETGTTNPKKTSNPIGSRKRVGENNRAEYLTYLADLDEEQKGFLRDWLAKKTVIMTHGQHDPVLYCTIVPGKQDELIATPRQPNKKKKTRTAVDTSAASASARTVASMTTSSFATTTGSEGNSPTKKNDRHKNRRRIKIPSNQRRNGLREHMEARYANLVVSGYLPNKNELAEGRYVASSRCGTPGCVAAHHLVWETRAEKYAREKTRCPGSERCQHGSVKCLQMPGQLFNSSQASASSSASPSSPLAFSNSALPPTFNLTMLTPAFPTSYSSPSSSASSSTNLLPSRASFPFHLPPHFQSLYSQGRPPSSPSNGRPPSFQEGLPTPPPMLNSGPEMSNFQHQFRNSHSPSFMMMRNSSSSPSLSFSLSPTSTPHGYALPPQGERHHFFGSSSPSSSSSSSSSHSYMPF